MPFGTCMWLWLPWFITMPSTSTSSAQKNEKNQSTAFKNYVYQYLKVMKCTINLFVRNVPLPTEVPGTAARFFYHWGRQLKSQQNEGFCVSIERSEVLLDVLSVMLTLRLASEAVNKSGWKNGLEVGIELCSPIPTITKLYGSVSASILDPPSFVIVMQS